ncbi:Uncharacterized protein CFAP97D2 [Geodia barretti]|uniref:Uncharacterized protein CFAP97D2 n=1 Tax=Geodia barretti TaxID=519541 RepID=A0AA35W2W8_GEOBA|nr:Uncharacterized protein CFAP97D2 [Geodia barretti]
MASSGASGHSTGTVSASKGLQRMWDERKLEEHRERLRRVKPTVDNGPPTNFVHLKQNLRKRQIEEDRWRLVDRHNRELLMRMNTIMHSTGRVEHRNLDWKPKKSIGYIKRQEEMQRVQRENQVHNMLAINRYSSTAFLQAILKRIQTVKPQYSVKQWESDYHSHVERCRSMSQTLSGLGPSTRAQREPRKRKAELHLPPIHPIATDKQLSDIQEEIDVET